MLQALEQALGRSLIEAEKLNREVLKRNESTRQAVYRLVSKKKKKKKKETYLYTAYFVLMR